MSRALVIIPSHGDAERVEGLVSDLLDVSGGLQIVVVDDHAPEPLVLRWSREVVRQHHLVVTRRTYNGGFAAAVNTGLTFLSDEHDAVLILNSDLRVDAHSVEALLRAVERFPYALLAPRCTRADGTVEMIPRKFPTVLSWVAEYLVALRLLPRLDRWLRDFDVAALESTSVVETDWLAGTCIATSPAVLHALGPMDEGFGMFSEEIDWQLRAAGLGMRRLYHPGITVMHDIDLGREAGARADQRFVWLWSSRFRYARKHLPPVGAGRLRLAMAFATFVNLVSWFVALARAEWRARIRAQARRHLTALVTPAATGWGTPRIDPEEIQ